MANMISVLGSTGSIGRQTLAVCEEMGIPVAALTAESNIERLEQQAKRLHPRFVAVRSPEAALELAHRLAGLDIEVASGEEGLIKAAVWPESCTVVTAVVGMAGLVPTLAAVRAGKRIALANKETLVCGGEVVMREAKQYGAEIIPVDSEHSAIFQCLQGIREPEELRRVILTCSGGPFYGLTREETAYKTKADALKHPNWSMGEKITIDCATLMNKGLEFIEAMHLFHLPWSQISVMIHRQSIVHSMIELRDGAVLAQLGTPDMKLPIRYALTYPNRGISKAEPLDLLSCPPLTFAPPDERAFPCLRLAMDCAKTGGTAGAVLNGANEAAVSRFLRGEISFGAIYPLVAEALQKIPVRFNPSLEDILEADQLARQAAGNSL